MTSDLLLTVLAVAASALYMGRHILKEIRASRSGKCGACELKQVCADQRGGSCDLGDLKTVRPYDPGHTGTDLK